jgi:hypothetical protein
MGAHNGGQWLDAAAKVRALAGELAGTKVGFWSETLEFLARDCEREAGAEGEREVESWRDDHPVRRAA